MMNASPFSKYSLFVVSAAVLVTALITWNLRGPRPPQSTSADNNPDQLLQRRERQQRAVALLFRAFHADNNLTYSAVSQTMAKFGGREMEAVAHVTRAPQSLTIEYTEGAQRGLRSGYNERWFWRQNPGGQIEAYAAMQRNAGDIAARRFALMLENYDVEWLGRDETKKGHPVEIIELRPFHPALGAQGPCKRIAIDPQNGLTRRVETFDHNERLVMSTTLTNINYKPNVEPVAPDKIIEVSRRKDWMIQDLGQDRAKVVRLTGLQPPDPAYLPQGFEFDTVGVHHCNYKKAPFQAALARYTDGLNTLTIFVMKPGPATCDPKTGQPDAAQQKPLAQPIAAQTDPLIAAQNGAGQSCDFGPGTLAVRDTPQGRLVAVGDLPLAVLQRVLSGASPVRSENAPSNQER